MHSDETMPSLHSTSVVSLLAPRYCLDGKLHGSGFYGRAQELTELTRWLGLDIESRKVSEAAPEPVRLLTGPGGMGKTRLAHELAWVAKQSGIWDITYRGGLSYLGPAVDPVNESRLPRLIVVDNAEHRLGLAELIAAAERGPIPTRILLVARSAGAWWLGLQQDLGLGPMTDARNGSERERGLVTTLSMRPDVEKSPVQFMHALALDFATLRGRSLPLGEFHLEGVTETTSTVELVEAALVVAESGPQQPAALDLSTVPMRLRMIEQEAWQARAHYLGLGSLEPDHLDIMVAMALLLGSRAHVFDLGMLLDRLDIDYSRPALQLWLTGAETRSGRGQIQWLGAHRAAEYHVITTLEKLAGQRTLPDHFCAGVPTEQLAHLVLILGRVISDIPGAEAVVERLLPQLSEVTRRMGTASEPERRLLHAAIPAEAGVLTWLQFHVETDAKIPEMVERAISFPEEIPRGDGRCVDIAAWSINDKDALERNDGKIAVIRALAAADPLAHEPDLADALLRRGRLLGSKGYRKDAYKAFQEALALTRGMVTEPSLNRRRQLEALTGLRVSRQEPCQNDSLELWTEEIELHRLIVAHGSGQERLHFASSLQGYILLLVEVGRYSDALNASTESVEMLRLIIWRSGLAGSKHQLALALLNQSRVAQSLGDDVRAMADIEEAVSMLRALRRTCQDRGQGAAAERQFTEALVTLRAVYLKCAESVKAQAIEDELSELATRWREGG